jgi:hypothetical protein
MMCGAFVVNWNMRHEQHIGQQPTLSTVADPDASFIGISFPVSASVETPCTRNKLRHKLDLCERQHNALAEMAQEPRDNIWAPKTETLIQDKVTSQGPGIYSVRNIECRSSICAVEVESLSDPYIGADYDFLATNGLIDGLTLFATPETDSSGRQINVTLVIFTKFYYPNRQ